MRNREYRFRHFASIAAICCCAGCLIAQPLAAKAEPVPVQLGADARLVYGRDQHGNRVPDFSHCGYAGADRDIPTVPVRINVEPADGDDGLRIQAAIDSIAGLPLRDDGFRGAVLLAPGEFQIAGQLRIDASGVVLRGSGAGDGGTTLVATGLDRRALVHVAGANDRKMSAAKRLHVVDQYAPVGANRLRLESTEGLHVGQTVLITRPSTAEWIAALGMDAFGVAWKPGTRDLRWDRVVTAIDGDTITLDAPITTAIEPRFRGASVEPYEWPGRITNVGVEDLRMRSAHDDSHPKDEEHAWFGVTMDHVANAWVRRIEFRHFAGGAVALWEGAKWVTVEDCIALEPVSELAGYRRRTFYTQGQLNLFLRCWAAEGGQDFAVGHGAAGPNAFVNCHAAHAHDHSAPVESWASGVLYDNVRIDGAGLHLENRWSAPPGAGWAAANCVLWQCRAATIHCFRPPTADNWVIGCWAEFAGDGTFAARHDFVRPQSLYQTQLRERVGAAAASRVDPILGLPVSATNPSPEEAAAFVEQSRQPARQLIDVIRQRWIRPPASSSVADSRAGTEYGVPSTVEVEAAERPAPDAVSIRPAPAADGPVTIQNGLLVVDSQLKTGGRISQGFWRGTTRPDEAAAFGPAITRFVPGRVGPGFTDDLEQLTARMLADGVAVFDHHYGLWYDRRRDDHLMARRADGNVAPPFFEQPFARTGRGTAWDGLSQYDLTAFNPWYWRRLRDFARLCDRHGLVLVHQNYFQHNILEAGAHWADSPWRPANHVNDTGLPEPPPYVGDKRIFMAHHFYDVANPKLRALHRGYIRQCLDSFADTSNVIQMTSAEYSGPLEFTQFWLDTIIEWQQEHGRDVLVGLSAPKDVQDAILADPLRSPHVDVIDVRYWAYAAGGGLYAPAGGQNLAARQHLRQTRQKPGGAAAIVRAVSEYRARFPDKAVIYHADQHCPSIRDGWATLIAGGSLPDVHLPQELARILPRLRPADAAVSGPGQWCLADADDEFLVYSANDNASVTLNLPSEPARYRIRWIEAESGAVTSGGETTTGGPLRLEPLSKVLWLSRTDKD